MNCFRTLAVAAVFAATFSAANASVVYANAGLGTSSTTLTFDEVVLSSGTAVTNQYAAFGVTFNGAYFNSQVTSFPPATSGNLLGNFSPVNSVWSILFSSVASEAAFGIATNPNTTTVEALLNGVVVGSVSAATDFDGTDFFQVSGLSFNEIRLSTSGDNLALIDNLQFSNANNIPEPGSLALIGLGLIGLVARRRKSV
jgi:hypothetical protein